MTESFDMCFINFQESLLSKSGFLNDAHHTLFIVFICGKMITAPIAKVDMITNSNYWDNLMQKLL